MLSPRARFIIFLMRNRHLLAGRKKKETFDENTSIAGFREQCERGAARYAKNPEGVEVIPESMSRMDDWGTSTAGKANSGIEVMQGSGEGPTAQPQRPVLNPADADQPVINAEWLIPAGSNPDKLILYVHGGGYVSGSCIDHRGFVSKFAKTTGYTCLVFEYRLAPEHPFPAAVEDSVTVYTTLLNKGFQPGNILVAGESAGGGLTLALLLALKERGIPHPVAAVAISPWTDLTCSGPSYTSKNKASLAPLNSWHVFSRHYSGNTPPDHPLISPLFGELQGLPPIFINSGTDDELYDDGEQFAKKAREAGVDVTFRAGQGMFHCYPLMAPMFREATAAMAEISGFIGSHLK